jgi:hypothetical protein
MKGSYETLKTNYPFLSLYIREELPLFGKWFDRAHHPELVEGEGRGEIFRKLLENLPFTSHLQE